MNTIEAILTRTSIRKFTNEKVEDEKIRTILKAGMSGPSCVNSRDWSFIVVTDREKMNAMADINGRAAQPLRGAAFAVLVCGDLERAYERAPEYWVIDGSIATQNMILAAKDMGIGSVWLGTWPQENKVNGQKALFHLPDNQIPHSIIAFGYPDEAPEIRHPEWEEDRIHYETW